MARTAELCSFAGFHAGFEIWSVLQTSREFPFDNLKEELGGGFGPQALEERMQASASEG
jgi:hypothetical protein